MSRIIHALSLKQPWAALVVHGLKTVEVRRWATRRRGLVLIHAATSDDDRRTPWRLVTDEVEPTCELRGGVIGAVEIADCLTYDTRKAFAADRDKHLNPNDWFVEPALFGFVLRKPRLLPFLRLRGWFKFFRVEWKRRDRLGD